MRDVDTDIVDLLQAYRAFQALAARPPVSITLPERLPFSAAMRFIHRWLRPTWGAERWTAARVRRRVEALERALAERLAFESPGDGYMRARQAVQWFKESLPPAPSRFVALGAFVAAVVLAQTIINVRATNLAGAFGQQPDLGTALGAAGATPNADSVGALLQALNHANFELVAAFVTSVMLSAYVICRASACGYRMAGLALGRPDGLGVPRRQSDLRHRTDEIGVAQLEKAAFAEVGATLPREFPFDLAVKALLASAVLFTGFSSLRSTLPELEIWLPLLVVGGVRLLWLARASHKRGHSVAWLGIPTTILAVAGLTVSPGNYVGAEPKNQELSLTLSLRHDLSGVDLRNRDLSVFYLVGKDLDGALLDGAKLDGASLHNARLRGADLTSASLNATDLRGADLRGATLSGTEFTDASLCGTDMRNTNTRDGSFDGALYDRRTRWPNGVVPSKAELYTTGCDPWQKGR